MQKRKSGQKPRTQKIVKNSNPFIIQGALTVPFELMTTNDGQIITCHVKNCVANGFVHNHDKANEWLKNHAGEAVLYILQQMIKNAKAAIQQNTDGNGNVTEQKVIDLEAMRNKPEVQQLAEERRQLPRPEDMLGAADQKPE